VSRIDDDPEVTIEAGGRKVHTTLGGLERAAQRLELGDSEPEGHQLSDEVADVANRVINSDARFSHIPGENIRMAYVLVWGKEPEGRGGIHVLAKAVKAPPLWRDLGDYDVAIVANQKVWARLPERAREALVAHELNHVGGRNDSGTVVLLEHDIEEFAWVVRKYGQWHSGLEHFAEQLGLGLQVAQAQKDGSS
jgi:putative metallopeptidase